LKTRQIEDGKKWLVEQLETGGKPNTGDEFQARRRMTQAPNGPILAAQTRCPLPFYRVKSMLENGTYQKRQNHRRDYPYPIEN